MIAAAGIIALRREERRHRLATRRFQMMKKSLLRDYSDPLAIGDNVCHGLYG